jgi:hypothetical protein
MEHKKICIPLLSGRCEGLKEHPKFNAPQRYACAADQPADNGKVEGQNLVDRWVEVMKKVFSRLEQIQAEMEGDALIPPPPPPPSVPLPVTPEGLRAAIEGRRVIPVLGPSCAASIDSLRPALNSLGKRLDALYRTLELDEKEFLASVVRSRIAVDLPEGRGEEMGGLLPVGDLQKYLVQAGMEMCTLLGRSLQANPRGFRASNECSVSVQSPDAVELRELLSLACRQADSMQTGLGLCPRLTRNGDDGPSECLWGGRSAGMSLAALALRLFPDLADGVPGSHEPDGQGILSLAAMEGLRGDGLAGMLTLADLEWLCALLWHSLRYDLPMFPDQESLAFHLALCRGSTQCCVRLGALAETVPDATECSIEIFQARGRAIEATGFQPNPTLGIYAAVAKTIAWAHSSGRTADDSTGPRTAGPQPGFMARAARPGDYRPALAITLNLDSHLEDMLARVRYPHYVLLPVLRGEKVLWLLRFNSWTKDDDGSDEMVSRYTLLAADLDFNAVRKYISEGPVVVKLNGSPTDSIPGFPIDFVDAREAGGPNRPAPKVGGNDLCHKIVLSDSDFLQTIVQTRMPRWVAGALCEAPHLNRMMLAFIGYPPGDLQSLIELEMYREKLSEVAVAGDHPGPTLIVTDAPPNPLRHAALRKLGVSVVEVEMEKFAREINRLLWPAWSQTVEGYVR